MKQPRQRSTNQPARPTPRPAARRIDWIIIGLRWLLMVLAGMLILLFLPTYPLALGTPIIVSAFLVIAVYNLAMMALLALGMGQQPWFSWLILAGDLALSLIAFAIPGGSNPLLIWIALFPVLLAAVQHEWWVSLSVAVTLPIIDAFILLIFGPPAVGTSYGMLFFAALIFMLLGALVSLTNADSRSTRRNIGKGGSTQGLRSQMRVVYDMAAQISASLDYMKVLDTALSLSESGLKTIVGEEEAIKLVGIILLEGEGLEVITYRRLTAADEYIVCDGQEGLLAEVIRLGNPVFSNEPFHDPELSRFAAIRACRSLMVVPLKVGFETFGMVVFAHPAPNFFKRDRVELLQAISNQAIVAMQNAKLYQDLLDEKERIVDVEEEARKKLARDLHDGPTQQVAALAMRTNFIRRLVERDPKQAVEELYKVEELARRTTKEIRQMLFTLRPLILESQGLVPALYSLAEKARDNHGQNIIIQAEEGTDEKLDKQVQGVLFYIVEEALGNARKHAEASHIWVRLRMRGTNVMRLEIEDDGVGFNVGEVDASYDQRTSLGMVNMRERAELISGTIHIHSVISKGTRIRILIPLTDEAREQLHAV